MTLLIRRMHDSDVDAKDGMVLELSGNGAARKTIDVKKRFDARKETGYDIKYKKLIGSDRM